MNTKCTHATEFIRFRLFSMPCCGQLLCWVNPRMPNYCPECGSLILDRIRAHPEQCTIVDDTDAQLRWNQKP